VSRQYISLLQSLSWGESQKVSTHSISRCINGLAGSIGQPRPFGAAPEPLTGIQLGGSSGQPAGLDPQRVRGRPTDHRGMGRAAIDKEPDVPAPLSLAALAQEGLVGSRRPIRSNQELDMTGRDVERAVDHPSGVVTGDGPLRLDPDLGPAGT
jgi:hypothetical protein